jgi:protein-tyrosine phosphatase
MDTVAVCFVCLGNICRSPTAEAVMRHQLTQVNLAARVQVDSAGTGGWHIGEAPDDRAQQAGLLRGYDLSQLRGRQISAADFERFDLLIAMDDANVAALNRICPPQHRDKIRLLMEFAPQGVVREVADPYFGGVDGFDLVLDQCEAACRGLVTTISSQVARPSQKFLSE